jgi:hypothetical protein
LAFEFFKFFKKEYRYSSDFKLLKIISVEDYRENAVVDVDNDDKLVKKIDIPTF